MPPPDQPAPLKSLDEIVEQVGHYARDAYKFVQEGLHFTVTRLHGEDQGDPEANRHITGQQLCDGLRQFALMQWGMLARTVLGRWGISSTLDFGRIVFALVEHGHMSKTDQDTLEDFRNVYDFSSAFEGAYRIEHKSS
jgi:uncharacterized repeat protein (TIGR04138 family)